MKLRISIVSLLVAIVIFAGAGSIVGGQGTADNDSSSNARLVGDTVANKISYQGMLRENGSPVTGNRDMSFEFWDNNACIGSSPSFTVSKTGVVVNNGLFSVSIPISSSFSGAAYWLRVVVGDTPLGCQELLPAPYALTLRPGATINAIGETALTLGSSSGNALLAISESSSGGTDGVALIGRNTSMWGGKAGILGETASQMDWTIGVWGRANAPTGVTSGVWGQTESTTDGARGVTGWAHASSGATYGVRGDSESPAGTGVAGFGNSPTGSTYGVYGETSSTSDWTVAVWGHARGASGVTTGAWGTTDSSTGGARGVMGLATATSGETYGVVGKNYSPSGWAAKFESAGKGVWIETELDMQALGVQNGDVSIDQGDLWVGGDLHLKGDLIFFDALPYNSVANDVTTDSDEPAEEWRTGYGFGVMEGDVAHIIIDPTFAQTANLAEPYHVFVQVYGDAEVFVTDRTPTGFIVRLREGDADVEFSYSIVAKGLELEDQQMETPVGVGDSSPSDRPDINLEQ